MTNQNEAAIKSLQDVANYFKKERDELDQQIAPLELRIKALEVAEVLRKLQESPNWALVWNWLVFPHKWPFHYDVIVVNTTSDNPWTLTGKVHRYTNGEGKGHSISQFNSRQFTYLTHDGRHMKSVQERRNVFMFYALTDIADYDSIGL